MRLLILVSILAVGMPSIAIGQDVDPPAPPQPPINFRPGVPNAINRAQTWQGMSEHAISMRLRYAHQQPQDRWERAQRLAVLANSGHCAEARQIADREGDFRMAAQLTRSCDLPDLGRLSPSN